MGFKVKKINHWFVASSVSTQRNLIMGELLSDAVSSNDDFSIRTLDESSEHLISNFLLGKSVKEDFTTLIVDI
jgi:hypothetical protein